MQLQGSAGSVQGGTGINVGGTQPYTQPINTQPVGGLTDTGYTAPVYTAPAAPTYYYDSAGNAFTSQSAAQASTNNILSGQRDASVGVIQTGENQNFADAATSLTNQVNPFLNTVKAGQTAIDQSRENASLNRLSSIHDLLDSIRQGIVSFGVGLANRNASDSGAAEAGARAYALEGNKGYSQIEQGHALAMRGIDTNQSNFDTQNAETARQLHQSVTDNVNRITSDTQMRLEQLSADAAYAGLSPLDVAGLRQQIIANGQAQLQAVDQSFTSRMSGITPEDAQAAEAKAYGLYSAGQPAPGGYAFTVASPAIGGGAPISQTAPLPIFTGNKTQNFSNSVA